MPTWTFVRHGQSVANVEGWLAGQYDTPLTAHGESQARAASETLPRPIPPRAFCSDLSRAHRTAQLLLEDRQIPLIVTPRLRERGLGAWRRRTLADLAVEGLNRERLGTWRGRPPGGESLLEVALRVAGWAATIDDSPEPTLIVAHGALMRATLVALDGLPRERLGHDRPKNCQAIERQIPMGRWAELLDELRHEAGRPD